MIKTTSFTEEERAQMAEAYLTFGTFRSAEEHTNWSKTTIHKVVSIFIEDGGFRDVDSLKELVERNTRECASRGGRAVARKWRELKR